ncbi:MAG: O-antigen ligase family protein [Patescibacteria group bacterium]|nr:O-antigen ligase family protein [Patescibacteria group bacterium]
MINDLLNKLTKFFLYAAPFSAVIVSRGTLFPFIVGKYVFFRTTVGLALIFFLWQWAANKSQIPNPKSQNFWKQPLVVAVSIFAIIYIISGFFGYNPSFSFWSNFERGEGGLQMIFLLVYFLLLVAVFRDKESWKKMLIAAVWAMVLVIGYGVGAALGINELVGEGFCSRFSGSLGNPAYLGTYMLFAIFYAIYLLVEKIKDKKLTLVTSYYLLVPIFFFIFLLLSQTRGAFLGLGAAIISGLLYLFFNSTASKKIRLFSLFFAAVLIISGSLAIKYRNSINLSMPFCGEKGTRLLDVSLNTQNMQTRLLLWKQSIAIFKEKPIFGWGMENFNVPFEKHYDPRFEVWYDRAHNIFFDYLTMTGILGLLSFVGIFMIYYWQFFKFSKQESALVVKTLFFSLPIAYLVQGLALFDVLPVYINLFLFLAFSAYKFQNSKQ